MFAGMTYDALGRHNHVGPRVTMCIGASLLFLGCECVTESRSWGGFKLQTARHDCHPTCAHMETVTWLECAPDLCICFAAWPGLALLNALHLTSL